MLSKLPVMIVSMILASVIGLTPVLGDSRIQGDNPNDSNIIVIEGPVQAINVNVITIANIEVVINVDNPVLNTLQVGNVVEVISQVSSAPGSDHIIADSIVVTSSNIVSPTITLRGPIQAVNANIVTIFNLNIQFNPDDPLLTELNVGDVIEVDGNLLILGESSIVIPVQVSIIVNISPPVIPPDPGNGVLINGFRVIYGGRVFENNQTTFTYVVSGTGTPPDLSHFDIEIVGCVPELEVVSFSPTDAVSFGLDPTTGVNGIKWDLPLLVTDARQYSLTFAGNISEGVVTIAVKGGNGFESGQLPGASCSNALVDIEKYVSTDNATWQDADAAPGPDVEPGTPVSFRFVVSNIGEINLTNLALTDSVYDLGICTVPATLPAGAF
ncbi:MAG: hypothetical protein K8L99_11770, partial [Anaerolineae bacterium]|nr:hypothetical protein [Anaerolineae bacterium]